MTSKTRANGTDSFPLIRSWILHQTDAANRGDVYKKVLLKIRKIHRKTPVPESLFSKNRRSVCGSLYYKVAGLEANIAQSAYFCQHNIYIVFIRIVFLRYLQLSKTFSLLQKWRVSIWGVMSRTVIFSVGNLSNHIQSLHQSLHEKYANNEFFLVRIFPHLDQKKLRIWTLHAVNFISTM